MFLVERPTTVYSRPPASGYAPHAWTHYGHPPLMRHAAGDYESYLVDADYNAHLWAQRRAQLARRREHEAEVLAQQAIHQVLRAQAEAAYRARLIHAERERERLFLLRRRAEEERQRMLEQRRLARRNAMRIPAGYCSDMMADRYCSFQPLPASQPQSSRPASLEDILRSRARTETDEDVLRILQGLLNTVSPTAPRPAAPTAQSAAPAVQPPHPTPAPTPIPAPGDSTRSPAPVEDLLRARADTETDPEVLNALNGLLQSLNPVTADAPAPVPTQDVLAPLAPSEPKVPAIAVSPESAPAPSSPSRPAALATMDRVASDLDTLTSTFVLPTTLDFAPSRPSSPTPSAHSSSSAGGSVLGLAYTPANRTLHAHEAALARLLDQLDAIESDGDDAVRTRRRELVRAVEATLERLERDVEAQRAERSPVAESSQAVPVVADHAAGATLVPDNDAPVDVAHAAVPMLDEVAMVDASELASSVAPDVPMNVDDDFAIPLAATADAELAVEDHPPDVAPSDIAPPAFDDAAVQASEHSLPPFEELSTIGKPDSDDISRVSSPAALPSVEAPPARNDDTPDSTDPASVDLDMFAGGGLTPPPEDGDPAPAQAPAPPSPPVDAALLPTSRSPSPALHSRHSATDGEDAVMVDSDTMADPLTSVSEDELESWSEVEA